ncbi:uncharacterized protein LOC131308117 isoform X1 [Rhododendron vialii]|uniref:uncharacterized protein LOC131308117 isoform X1 n=1 Tax=Rhododendron vialii TaxID=182163 RepID=UPI00265EFD09|nr:uncharacterized protein LOC131308117 isoform X1 [Rhododendron vialii]
MCYHAYVFIPYQVNGRMLSCFISLYLYLFYHQSFFFYSFSILLHCLLVSLVVRMQVVPEMQPRTSHLQRAPTRNQHDASPICERVTRSTPHPDVGAQPQQPLDVEQEIQAAPFVAPVVADRPIHGPTRGLMVQQIFDKEGKLLVPIPQCFRAPVGKHACKLATQIGVEVRTNLEDLTIRRWKVAHESVKAPMLQRIKIGYAKGWWYI